MSSSRSAGGVRNRRHGPGATSGSASPVPALIFFETTALTGFLIHGELALVVGGVAAERGNASLSGLTALTWLAAIAGDSVSLLLGRPFLERHGARFGADARGWRAWSASSRATAARRSCSGASPA